jgi:hypothetical protein
MAGGRPMAVLEVSDAERRELESLARRRKTAQALALRARIVLHCAEGLTNTEVATRLAVAKPTVGKWRQRFVRHRLDGLHTSTGPSTSVPGRRSTSSWTTTPRTRRLRCGAGSNATPNTASTSRQRAPAGSTRSSDSSPRSRRDEFAAAPFTASPPSNRRSAPTSTSTTRRRSLSRGPPRQIRSSSVMRMFASELPVQDTRSTTTATSFRCPPKSCPRSTSPASDRCRTLGIDEAARRPDSARLRVDTRKTPLLRGKAGGPGKAWRGSEEESTQLTSRSSVRQCLRKCHSPGYPSRYAPECSQLVVADAGHDKF